jgi:tetratricopeptide (TPR) repeat protein
MTIWSSEIRELEKLNESLKGQLPDLEKELERLIKADDENMILLYSRRCLEVIITDLCECELKRPRKTEPLKGIIDKLHKEGKVPSHIITSMHGLNELSTYGAHPKDFDPEQIKPVLNNLDIIIKWYLKYKNIVAISKTEGEGEKEKLRDKLFKEEDIEVRKEMQEKPAKAVERKLISILALGAILLITAIFAYPKIFKRDTLEKLRASGERISVAVMPFQNMTNDTILNVWQDGIQINLITSLSNNPEELKVRQLESITDLLQSKGLNNYASITPSVASDLSQKLDANVCIQGSINQSGSTLRLNAQLVDSKSEEIFKSFQANGTTENILYIIDSLSIKIRDFLIISVLNKKIPISLRQKSTDYNTNSLEAFRYFAYGQKALANRDWSTATKYYLQSLAIDSTFIPPYLNIVVSYTGQGMYDQAKKWAIKAYEKRDQMSERQRLFVMDNYTMVFETPQENIKWVKQVLEVDDQFAVEFFYLGGLYSSLYQFDKAIPEYEKSLEIYKKWRSKPMWVYFYTNLGYAYHKKGQFRKEKKLYRKAGHDFPDDPTVIFRQTVLTLSEGKIKDANEYLEKFKSIRKDQAASEATIIANMANIYWQAEILDKAEEYFREALSLEPESLARMNNLGWFLIDTDRNIKEGLEINNKALVSSPDNYFYLDCKGWGLFKMGKFQEALVILQKSWDLRMKNAVYSHTPFLHLEAAKKAVANQTNN